MKQSNIVFCRKGALIPGSQTVLSGANSLQTKRKLSFTGIVVFFITTAVNLLFLLHQIRITFPESSLVYPPSRSSSSLNSELFNISKKAFT